MMEVIVKRLIKSHESSKNKLKLSRQMILVMLKYNVSSQIVTQITLTKFKRKISHNRNAPENNSRSIGIKKGNDDEVNFVHSLYYNLITYITESRFFKSSKNHVVPSALLLYWSWRNSQVRKLTKILRSKIVHLTSLLTPMKLLTVKGASAY